MPSNVEDVLEQVFRARKWIGIHPLNKKSSVSWFNFFVAILLVSVPCLIRIFIIIAGIDYHRQGGSLNSHLYSSLSVVQSFVMLGLSLVFVFGYLSSWQRYGTVKHRLVACDVFLRRLQPPIDYDKTYIKHYIWTFSIFCLLMAGFDTLTRNYDLFWFIYGLIYYYHKAVVWIGELLFVAIVKIISLQMLELQRSLRNKNVLFIEKIVIEFNRLIKVCYDVNDLFSLSNLLTFTNYFISLTLNTYYVSLIIDKGYYYRSAIMLSLISFRILGSFLIVQSAEEISRQCKYFNEELGAVMMIRDSINFENETLLSFMRMKKDFKFNAIRYFNIDKRFYLTMLSMVVSYIVLIFQLTSSDYCEP